ncbi:MAG: hypothetical protein SAK29_05480 [Scytonema sp. PMC 1069.18]|nr:hypothetical protein [Scytonema sp. PMC 1069.18]MEC4882217.1 hypothetical protein [Scytonema sp. PMC 1070.18]
MDSTVVQDIRRYQQQHFIAQTVKIMYTEIPAPQLHHPNIVVQVDQQKYLDDRSTPIQVLKSYYNAINRKEYVRAYYYWTKNGTSATSQPPSYPQFEAGYANTAAVQLVPGEVNSSGAAGSIYYEVPVILRAKHTDGTNHTFVGCYVIKQPDPKIFGAPPFIPMGIYSAQIREVSSSANIDKLMEQSCQR